MQLRSAQRRWEKLHEEKPWHNGDFTIWHDKQTRATPFYYLDGVTIWLADEDHDLGGDFLEHGSAASTPHGEQPERDAADAAEDQQP